MQEEPHNGAWLCRCQLPASCWVLSLVVRDAGRSASPRRGSEKRHKLEQAKLIKDALGDASLKGPINVLTLKVTSIGERSGRHGRGLEKGRRRPGPDGRAAGRDREREGHADRDLRPARASCGRSCADRARPSPSARPGRDRRRRQGRPPPDKRAANAAAPSMVTACPPRAPTAVPPDRSPVRPVVTAEAVAAADGQGVGPPEALRAARQRESDG